MKDHTPLKARSQIRHLSKEDIEQYTESIPSMSTTEEVVSFVKTQF